ncbi:MAG: hypothetical protein CSA62_09170 [Planctomycetota bacterium]|nr:MAG: hypothetical protein CSA62_09170 [Planctomycetota bacterium]
MAAAMGVVLGFVLTVLPFAVLGDPWASLPEIGQIPALVRSSGIPQGAVTPTPLLPKRKEGELRLFFVGASMTFGLPFQPTGRSSYACFLEQGLRKALGRSDLHVRPDAYPGADSPQLAEMAERCLGYGASHLVLVVGTNEYLRRIAHGRPLRGETVLARLAQDLASPRRLWEELGQGAKAWASELLPAGASGGAGESLLGSKHKALGGLPVGEEDRVLVEERLRRSLLRVIKAAQAKGVPLILALAPHCLSITPPRWSPAPPEPGVDTLVSEELRQCNPARLYELTALLRRYADRPDLLHVLGRIQLRLGNSEAAIRNLNRAQDLDGAPMHRTSAIVRVVRELAREYKVRLLEFDDAFLGPDGLVREEYFLDYSHPSYEGQQRLARWLAEQLCGEFLPPLAAEEKLAFDQALRDYAKGAATMESRRLARAEIDYNNGKYFRLAGNYREALWYFERAMTVLDGEELRKAAAAARAALEGAK